MEDVVAGRVAAKTDRQVARVNRPLWVIALCLGISGIFVFPTTSVFAYTHDVRDDGGCCTGFTAYWNKNNGYQGSVWNGVDYDAEVTSQGSTVYAAYYPYPVPDPYPMCPYAHIPNNSSWAQGGVYYTPPRNQTAVYLAQNYWVGGWPNVTPQSGTYYYYNEYLTISPASKYTVSVDEIDFHYNANLYPDPQCM